MDKVEIVEKKKKTTTLNHSNDKKLNIVTNNLYKLPTSWVSKVIDTDNDEEKLADVYENGFAMYMQEKGIIPDDFKKST